jgi:hypothetical protein
MPAWRADSEKEGDAMLQVIRKGSLVLMAVVFSCLFVVDAAMAYSIKDDAFGGDCSLLGTWDWATRTCALTSDLGASANLTVSYGSVSNAPMTWSTNKWVYNATGIGSDPGTVTVSGIEGSETALTQ